MGKIIEFKEKPLSPPDNRITFKPWEFRLADWESRYFLQMLKSQSHKLERHRKEVYEKGGAGIWNLPPHFALSGGMASTIQGVYMYRANEERMREVYYLAGLVDCMINQVNPLLRTGLIEDLYKKVTTLRSLLNVNWYGSIDHVLFPLDSQFYNDLEYREVLSRAETMKELFQVIREGTGDMFDILSLEYTFYTPHRRA